MGSKRAKDKELWEKVKKTTKPLHNSLASQFASIVEKNVAENRPDTPTPVPVKSQTRIIKPWVPEKIPPSTAIQTNKILPRLLDDTTTRKIAKGRLEIEGRLDLHGLTRSEAHGRLYRFLANARKSGKRTVLVITGKGKLGEGILRTAVPGWLEEPDFRELTTGYHESYRAHGGEGALYIRLRRAGKP